LECAASLVGSNLLHNWVVVEMEWDFYLVVKIKYFYELSNSSSAMPRAIGWGAMPSWPMIEYQAEAWCLLVKHRSSHVSLALERRPSPTFWALYHIISIIKQTECTVQ
jgi:hypothetical protein